MVDQFSEGMVLKPAIKYQDVAHTQGRAEGQSLRHRAADCRMVGQRQAGWLILPESDFAAVGCRPVSC